MADKTAVSSGSSRPNSHKSINSFQFPIEFNVKMEEINLCTSNLFMSCILFLSDIIIEYFIILQWINKQYYIPIITLCIFIFISNFCNVIQWYSFNNYSSFKLCHFILIIIPFGFIGLLPLFSIIYYVCHSSFCCARIGAFHKDVGYQDSKVLLSNRSNNIDNNNNNNDVSERLLQPSHSIHSISSIDPKQQKHNDIFDELLFNITQLLCLQVFVRTVPFIFIELFVLITSTLEPTNWFLTGLTQTHLDRIHITINIPKSWHNILLNDLTVCYWISISISLCAYSFISVTYLDIIEKWQHTDFYVAMNRLLKLFHIIFLYCDYIIRSMPIILAIQCRDTLDWYYIVFGLQIIWYVEVSIWYEIYQYFPDFPMRKIYPHTYNTLTDACLSPILSSPVTISHIAMQSQKHQNEPLHQLEIEISDHDSQKQYQNPQYIANGSNIVTSAVSAVSNAIVLSPVSASSHEHMNMNMDDSNLTEEISVINDNEDKVWVPKSSLDPQWGVVCEEYISAMYGLFGGVLICLSGWLIGHTLRHCVVSRQYRICIIELMFRYTISIGLMVIYANEYHSKLQYEAMDSKYRIWIAIFVACIVYIMPYIAIIHCIFKPKSRTQRLKQILGH